MAISTGAAILGGAVVSGVLGSNAAKKQAKTQAKAIENASAIDSEVRANAINQVVSLYGPALVDFNKSIQGSVDLMAQGKISTGQLLEQSANNTSNIIQQGGQAALNAMLGLPSPQPTQQPQGFPQDERVTGGYKPAQNNIDDVPVENLSDIQSLATDGGLGNQELTTIDPQYQNQGPQPANDNTSEYQDFNPSDYSHELTAEGNRIRYAWQQSAYDQAVQDNAINNTSNQDQQVVEPIGGQITSNLYDNQDQVIDPVNQGAPTYNQQGLTVPQDANIGMLGAEQAILGGANQGRSDMLTGAAGALNSLGTQTGIARNDLLQGQDFALNKISEAIDAGKAGYAQGVKSINQATQSGVGAIGGGVSQAVGFLNPYMQAGKQALNPLMDLSGVNGQAAFDAARMNDPAYNLAIKESERALGRNAAVTGGIGSGNTMGRFQLNAQEQAAADIDRQLSRFRAITDAGQSAASQAGSFTTQGGIASGNLLSQGGIAAGNLQSQSGQLESDLLTRAGDVGINTGQNLSMLAQQLGMSEADVLQNLGGNLSNISTNAGQQIGGLRETAGINAANMIQGTANQQAGIQSGLGEQLANLDQATLTNVINAIQSGAGTNLNANQQLATTLANLGIGAGSSAADYQVALGQAQASGVTNPIGNAINTGLGLYALGAFKNNNSSNNNYNQQGGYSPNQFNPYTPVSMNP